MHLVFLRNRHLFSSLATAPYPTNIIFFLQNPYHTFANSLTVFITFLEELAF